MFIKDDEFILLMQDTRGAVLTPDDLKRLQDVGVQTMTRYPFWWDVEPVKGEYHWEQVDQQVELAQKSGVKCLFGLYEKPPKYFPPDWYLQFETGGPWVGTYRERVMSPWSEEGWAYHLDFMRKFCQRVSSDDAMCFRATVHGGEEMLPHKYPYQLKGDYLETLVREMLEEQEIFYNAHPSHELWTCLHHAFDYTGTSGTEHARMLYQALRDKFPDATHYSISYTQFTRNMKEFHYAGAQQNRLDMQELGLKMFCGSEYAEGLLTNTDTAIQQGFRGLICGPIMFWTKRAKTEDWMFDNFAWSIKRWREAKHV